MDFANLIVSSRSYLDRFHYDEYPVCFAEFAAMAEPLFAALSESDPEHSADILIRELERRCCSLPKREKKEGCGAGQAGACPVPDAGSHSQRKYSRRVCITPV